MAAIAWETISLGTDTPGTSAWFHSVQSERSITNLSTVPPRGVSLHDLIGIILYHNVLSHLPLPPKGLESLIFKVINPRKWSSLRGRLHHLRWMHALLISCRSEATRMAATPALNHAAGSAEKWFTKITAQSDGNTGHLDPGHNLGGSARCKAPITPGHTP
jgi:hypothetical protein